MKRTLLATVFATLAFTAIASHAGNSLLKETDTEALGLKLANEVVRGGYQLISVAELKKVIDAKETIVLVDAHPKWEYDLAYIAQATNFGFQSNRVGAWEKDVTDGQTQEQFRALLGTDLNKKIVFYCGFTKCGRSHNAATWAKQLGYTNIYRAPGGISAWIDSSFPYKTNIK